MPAAARLILLLLVATLLPAQVTGLSTAPASDQPQVRQLYLVAPDILVLRIDAQDRETPGLAPYLPKTGDSYQLSGYDCEERLIDLAGLRPYYDGGTPRLFRRVIRDGQVLGYINGPDRDQILYKHRLLGQRLALDWADDSASYRLDSDDHAAYANARQPSAIHRKSRPRTPVGHPTKEFRSLYTQVHELYLQLPEPLQAGARYRLRFAGAADLPPELSFTVDATALVSEAIQVNQNGYHPDADKLAFLSTWMGSGGARDYSDVPSFTVIDDDGTVVHSGSPVLLEEQVQADDLTLTPVYGLDFSQLRQPGRYRIVVPGIGCSLPLTIAEPVWARAFRTVMKGYLHQRSGIALDAPLLATPHPRDLHPDDGYRVHAVDETLFFERFYGGDNLFDAMQKSLLIDQFVSDSWGGWRDAADFDRQADHMEVVGSMAGLYLLHPQWFDNRDLGTPESGDAMPDLLDEALWCADCFRRAQRSDGAVPSYIESIEHPRAELPATESLPLVWVPPRFRDALQYAASAALLAVAVQPHDPGRATDLADSAIAAWQWTRDNPDHPSAGRDTKKQDKHKGMLGAALYHLRGDGQWHQLFKDHYDNSHPYTEEWLYIHTDRSDVDENLQEQLRNRIIDRADRLRDRALTTIYRSVRDDYRSGETINLVWPEHRISVLVHGHDLTGDPSYLRAIENAYLFALGANPQNLVYITGLGQRDVFPRDKLFDNGMSSKPSGIPSPGFDDVSWGDHRVSDETAEVLYPSNTDWPDTEFFFPKVRNNEHTVQFMRHALWGFAYLAQVHGADIDDNLPPLIDAGPQAAQDPVTGTSVGITVDASDPEGEVLSYHWSVLDRPTGAPPPTITPAEAANATVDFGAAGNYHLQITITDPPGATVTGDLLIEVRQVSQSVLVEP